MSVGGLIAELSSRWWLLLMRGLLAIAFGVVAMVLPGIALVTLVFLWGAYALVDGIGAIVLSARKRWWGMLLSGALGVLAGIVALAFPGLTALTLLLLIGITAIVRGLFDIVAAIRLRREVDNEWWLVLGGAASIAFGVFVIAAPGSGALSLIWLISLASIVLGTLLVLLAFRVRGLHQRAEAIAATRPR